jgi:hypothetical protein
MKLLTEDTHSCLFARGNPLFKEAKTDTVLCIVDGDDKYAENRKLLVSDTFFKDSTEPKLDGYNHVRGLAGLASVKKFLVAAVRSAGTDEMALYVPRIAFSYNKYSLFFPDMFQMMQTPGTGLNSLKTTVDLKKMHILFSNRRHTAFKSMC